MASLPPISSAASQQLLSSQVQDLKGTEPGSKTGMGATEELNSNLFDVLLTRANEDQVKSNQGVEDLLAGRNDNVHEVVMQVVKAEMSFHVFMEVRNQVIESFNELMRMQF